MNNTLTPEAMTVLDQYLHFPIGPITCSVPYFNNKSVGTRAGLRVHIGKGSPADIAEETQIVIQKNKIDITSITSETAKKLLVDHKLGIDCSGFAYHILEAESIAHSKGLLKNRLVPGNTGFMGRMRFMIRPMENTSVASLADNQNSTTEKLSQVKPGDFITMLGNQGEGERDHILLIHAVDYENNVPKVIHYSHSIAYPTDGLYGTGVRQGIIEIQNPNAPLLDGRWLEDNQTGTTNLIYTRAQGAKIELRRLRWL